MHDRLRVAILYLLKEQYIHNNADLATKIGVHPSFLSEALNGKRTITGKFLRRVCDRFPMLNFTWLLVGEGEMVLLRPVKVAERNIVNVPHRLPPSFFEKIVDELTSQREYTGVTHSQVGRSFDILGGNQLRVMSATR